MKIDPKLTQIHNHASNNEIEILHSKTCSCFFCRQTYDARKVNDWINDERGVTALCPECGMDAVVGDASGLPLDKPTLKEMNLAYYGEDYMEKHPLAAEKYVNRYKEGKITHKAANEALYVQYLYLLASGGNAQAAYDLGSLFELGSEFTPADPKMAFSYYGMACLRKDGSALTRLGMLCESGALGKADPRGAYECYSKGMAMGSLEALVHFADCYLNGIFVVKDPQFAFDCLSDIWGESYRRFVTSTGKDINVFPDVSYRLGVLFCSGISGKPETALGLKLFLYSEFGFNLMANAGLLKGELIPEYADVHARIDALGKTFKLHRQDPVFDNDTFSDSLEVDENNMLEAAHDHCTIAPGPFDKDSGNLEFDITYDYPPLIVDVGNLFCGFVPDTIHWSFVDVSDARFASKTDFQSVLGDPDTGWQFIATSNGTNDLVASIYFTRPQKAKPVKDKVSDKRKGKA
jgi:hypothetical protein